MPNGHDQRIPTAEQAPRLLDRVLGVFGSVVAEQQRAVSGRRVSVEVDRERGDRQAKAVLNVFDEPPLLPVGVVRDAQGDQDVIGLERRDSIRDHRHDAPPGSRSAGVGADRVHVLQDGVEALVGVVPKAVDVVGEPGESSGERRREDLDLDRGVDDRAHRGGQLSTSATAASETKSSRWIAGTSLAGRRVGRCAVGTAHGALLSSGCSPVPGRGTGVGRKSVSSLSASSTGMPSSCWGMTSAASPVWRLR